MEQIELLGNYQDIPKILTIKPIPTTSELEYVSAEDFDKVMLDKILPSAIQDKIDPWQLLEIDYQWVCRCLRILNYGPYFTTNNIYCSNCGTVSSGEYRVNLNSISCKTLPEGFKNDVLISRDEFIDFKGDIRLKLPTVKEMYNAERDSLFKYPSGEINRELARICYMIKSWGTLSSVTPIDIRGKVLSELSPADYCILRGKVKELTDYGLRAGGMTKCPNCGEMTGGFFALADDKFFRPTLGDIKQWKYDRSQQKDDDTTGNSPRIIRANS